MVTKRKEWSDEERAVMMNAPQDLLQAYTRSMDESGIRYRVRFEPEISRVTLDNPSCAEYSSGPFFLADLHYQMLQFELEFLQWQVEISYEEFLDFLREAASGIDQSSPHILDLVFFPTGNVDYAIFRADRFASNIFFGLITYMDDQDRIAQGKPPPTKPQTLIPLTIDRRMTIPGPMTSFSMVLKEPYEKAAARTGANGQCGVILYNPSYELMDTELGAIVYGRNKELFTPPIGTGCHNDPLRMLLLELGIIKERSLLANELVEDEMLMIISAESGVIPAFVAGPVPQEVPDALKRRWRRAEKRKNQSPPPSYMRPLKMAQTVVQRYDVPGTSVFATTKNTEKKPIVNSDNSESPSQAPSAVSSCDTRQPSDTSDKTTQANNLDAINDLFRSWQGTFDAAKPGSAKHGSGTTAVRPGASKSSPVASELTKSHFEQQNAVPTQYEFVLDDLMQRS